MGHATPPSAQEIIWKELARERSAAYNHMLKEALASAGRGMLTTLVTLISFVFIPGGGLNIHQAVQMAVLVGFVTGARKAITLEIEAKDKTPKKLDNSPQARFARDEITQLEMEEEIDRQLALELSGSEQMSTPKNEKDYWHEQAARVRYSASCDAAGETIILRTGKQETFYR